MNGCLNERALLALYCEEEDPIGRSHLRLCADCAERYDALTEDLDLIGMTLKGTPPVPLRVRTLPLRPRLLAAAALGTLAAFVIGITVLQRPTPSQTVAHHSSLSALASDVSDAVFSNATLSDDSQLALETAYTRAVSEADWPCTQDRFLDGECTDQLTALLFEGN